MIESIICFLGIFLKSFGGNQLHLMSIISQFYLGHGQEKGIKDGHFSEHYATHFVTFLRHLIGN